MGIQRFGVMGFEIMGKKMDTFGNLEDLRGDHTKSKLLVFEAIFPFRIQLQLSLVYFFPLLFGTGAVPLHRDLWSDGYFSDIAKIIGGVWLRLWVQGASAVSNMGMFLAEMSGDSYQLLGMAERGMLPDFFAKRSRYGTFYDTLKLLIE
uniref:Uncharacterized protein n=1 Tax=Solanum lycopersicum TaxID=4081 RepID=A0A3Q7EMA4_SOLLC